MYSTLVDYFPRCCRERGKKKVAPLSASQQEIFLTVTCKGELEEFRGLVPGATAPPNKQSRG